MQSVTAEQLNPSAEIASAETRVQIEVVLPAYNEEKTIGRTIERISATLGKRSDSYRFLVVDDGSEDRTSARLLEYAKNGEEGRITLVRNNRNMGKGFAIKRAAKYVTGDVVAIMDADSAIDPKQLELYVDQLRNSDMCIGSKRHPNSIYEGTAFRKISSIGFNKMVRLATGLQESDTQTGLKVMKGKLFKEIMGPVIVKRYAYDVEMLLAARLLGAKVTQLPVKVEQDSGFKLVEMVNMLRDLLGIAFRLRVKKWYQRVLTREALRP